MRTTLTLDTDVAQMLRKKIAAEKKSLKQAVNEALRRGLKTPGTQGRVKPFRMTAWNLGGLRPGIDPTKLNQLLDDLEVETYLKSAAPRAKRVKAR